MIVSDINRNLLFFYKFLAFSCVASLRTNFLVVILPDTLVNTLDVE